MSLTTAADTLAAIPALLGFTPDNSVVIIALADDGNGSHLARPPPASDAHQAEPPQASSPTRSPGRTPPSPPSSSPPSQTPPTQAQH
ncbi:hypothetical protein BJF84_26990 [Rhodococcus sp. CUA-806]|nr:hypothetical protein BJF84_26990 [Rhodococcus sp. CUA-806]